MAVPEITIRGIQKSILNREGSYGAIAQKWKVSESTVKRIAKAMGGEGITTAAAVVQQSAIADSIDRVLASGFQVDRDALLTTAIQKLAESMENTKARSQEGAAGALAKLLELHAKFNPMTMRELVTVALNVPDFDPREFARLIREQVEKAS